MSFTLSCESTVDMPYAYAVSRNLPILFYEYIVDGSVYPDDMGRDPNGLTRFYHLLEAGKLPSTSQINEFQYETFFENLLSHGDVLHIAFGTGMTSSFYNAEKAAARLRKQYPERKIVVIDSLRSSSGYGLLVDIAADMRDQGYSLEQIAAWTEENRKRVHHQFFSTDLKYFRRSGRMSGSAAMLGSVLNICPIMRLDDQGHIIAYDKVRGKKNAIQRTVQTMADHAQGGLKYTGKCCICHANCLRDAQELKAAIVQRFPEISGDIPVYNIGTIIASHCGPGTVAVFFLGDERLPHRSND